ncbi:MAG: type II toxin-antitoxin system VapC family toxin, partial [Patescibacteria group bacterium]|nr:type II toxin-antitoxin system VapC family toxin [Patescibacteria group bacterium]
NYTTTYARSEQIRGCARYKKDCGTLARARYTSACLSEHRTSNVWNGAFLTRLIKKRRAVMKFGSYTVDSNILIYHLNGDEAATTFLAARANARDRLFISAITRIELLAAPALRAGEEKLILQLLAQCILIPVDLQVADSAAHIRREYRLRLGDSIIAATALLFNTPLVTHDQRFKQVRELVVLALTDVV